MTWIAPVYLRVLMERAATNPETPYDVVRVTEALEYAQKALDGEVPEPEAGPEPPLPAGQFARVELPGYRQHVGWVTDENRFGVQMAVVRDWDGREMAAAVIGPNSQVVYLPTPLKRPEPQQAITGWGSPPDFENDDEDDDNPF